MPKFHLGATLCKWQYPPAVTPPPPIPSSSIPRLSYLGKQIQKEAQ